MFTNRAARGKLGDKINEHRLMNENELKNILQQIQDKTLTINDAVRQFRHFPGENSPPPTWTTIAPCVPGFRKPFSESTKQHRN